MKKKVSLLELSKRETKAVKAGIYEIPGCVVSPNCFCACWYQDHGGSTTEANGDANIAGSLSSPTHNPIYS
jgi:hypothetical protein